MYKKRTTSVKICKQRLYGYIPLTKQLYRYACNPSNANTVLPYTIN